MNAFIYKSRILLLIVSFQLVSCAGEVDDIPEAAASPGQSNNNPADTIAPSKPSSLTVTDNQISSIQISWQASTDNAGIATYSIYRNGSFYATSNNTVFTDNNISGNTAYQYYVEAYDTSGNKSAVSSTLNITSIESPTSGNTPPTGGGTPSNNDTVSPTTPSSLVAGNVLSSSVSFSWNASTDDTAVIGYNIYRNGNSIGIAITNTFVDNAVASSSNYVYSVQAYDAANNRSSLSSQINISTPAAPPINNNNTVSRDYILFLNDAKLAAITADSGNANSPWPTMRQFCTDRDGLNPPWDYQGSQYYRYAVNFALCYRVESYLGNATAAVTHAENALRILNNNLISFSSFSNDSGYGIRNYGPGLAITYSWLSDYSGFTAGQRAAARSRMKEWTDWFAVSGYSRNEPIANYHAGYMEAAVLSSIAIYNDDPDGDTYLQTAISLFNDGRTLFDATMPGGHWPEGWSYGAGVYASYAMATAALVEATNDATYKQFSWLEKNIDLKLAALSPDGKYFYDDGLWSLNRNGVPLIQDMYSIGYLYGWDTPNGQKTQRYIENTGLKNSSNEWRDFLFYSDSAAAGSVADNNVSNSYHATGTGLVTMRGKRSDPNATWGSFIAGPYLSYENEQDFDQGHMIIYKTAPLLVDAGHGLYNPDNLTATQHHNTYTLENRTDVSFNGQRNNAQTEGCPNDPIGIEKYLDNTSSVFTRGEFSNAYKPKPLYDGTCYSPGIKSLTRNVFYLRPNLFFVYDQIEKIASQATVLPHMRLHFPTQPSGVNSNRDVTVNNGTGRLHVSTVFPVNSVNTIVNNSSTGAAKAGWTMDIAHSDNSLMYYNYLNVLRAGLNQSNYAAPVTTAISGNNSYGVFVSNLNTDELTNGSVTVIFIDSAGNGIPSNASYTLPGAASQSKNYILNLKANTQYSVDISTNGNTSITITEGAGSYTSDQSGMIEINL